MKHFELGSQKPGVDMAGMTLNSPILLSSSDGITGSVMSRGGDNTQAFVPVRQALYQPDYIPAQDRGGQRLLSTLSN